MNPKDQSDKLITSIHMTGQEIGTLKEVMATSVDKMIGSNQKLAESQNRHANAMLWFTGVMAVAAIVQVAVMVWIQFRK